MIQKKENSSNRQMKVASLINEILPEALKKGKMIDIRLFDVPLTFTKIIISKDLRIANCYYIPFNTKLTQDNLQEALDNSKYSIRYYITSKLQLKFSPQLKFHFEVGILNTNNVEQILKNI